MTCPIPLLLIATAAQNYGQNGYRIRRPFDFADRTGTIVFDGTITPMGPLYGWISLAITGAMSDRRRNTSFVRPTGGFGTHVPATIRAAVTLARPRRSALSVTLPRGQWRARGSSRMRADSGRGPNP